MFYFGKTKHTQAWWYISFIFTWIILLVKMSYKIKQTRHNICEQDFILDSCTQHHKIREQQAYSNISEKKNTFQLYKYLICWKIAAPYRWEGSGTLYLYCLYFIFTSYIYTYIIILFMQPKARICSTVHGEYKLEWCCR